MAKRIEVFTADCPLCKDTMKIVTEAACSGCEVIERRCSGDECNCDPPIRAVRRATASVPATRLTPLTCFTASISSTSTPVFWSWPEYGARPQTR